jgi:hypothetical protein
MPVSLQKERHRGKESRSRARHALVVLGSAHGGKWYTVWKHATFVDHETNCMPQLTNDPRAQAFFIPALNVMDVAFEISSSVSPSGVQVHPSLVGRSVLRGTSQRMDQCVDSSADQLVLSVSH